MKKIAIIFNGDLRDRKGYINAVIERAKRLSLIDGYCVDIFCISQYEHWLVRKLRHTKKVERSLVEEVDGLKINMMWYPFSLIDYFLFIRFHIRKIVEPFFLKRFVLRFIGYDLISAHSIIPSEVALNVKARYGVPYCVTWHGSDIHTLPFKNRTVFRIVSDLMESADHNIFVSGALQKTAEQISPIINSSVLYNAASDEFCCFDELRRKDLRNKYKVSNCDKVVAFAGNLLPIKNAGLLPALFDLIQQKSRLKIEFWIIGDGKLRGVIEKKLSKLPHLSCKLWGNQPVDDMPSLLNCVDVLILPSKNEGLPLIIVEALQCGANVVASDVGGIKEIAGEDNVIAIGDDFVQRFAKKVVDLLVSESEPPMVSSEFDWQTTSDKEHSIYVKIIKK